MSTYSDLVDRVGAATRRLDLVADAALERARYDVRAMRRADDAEREEQREQARRDRARCAEHQARFDERFTRHSVKAPLPAADEAPPTYRRRLFGIGQSLLPSGHELTGLDAADLDKSAIVEFERQLFDALDEEAESPSGSNLPKTVDDPRAKRERMDSAGGKTVTWHAKQSFIKGMMRPARRVLAFHGRDGQIIYPPRARGF
jgi:hypothetical protein